MLFVLSLFVTCTFGAIWDCPRKSFWDAWTLKRDFGATECANEGDECYGAGTYYYGSLSSWSVRTVTSNLRVPCNNAVFGCDPLPGFRKICMKADRLLRVDNQHIDEYKPLSSPTPVPECVPEGGSFEGDNDFCSMALVECQPSDQYVYWSKPDCGCGCKPAATAYEKYYKSETNSNSDEYGMEKDTKSNDYKPEPQYTSNNGEYIQNGYEMNAYSVPNKDNNYNNYGPKEGDKYDNDKYKKYDNDEPKDNLNDYKKNYRISDSVTIPVSDKPTPECVPEGGSFAGDNDFCAMALVVCEPRDEYVYWSRPQCGCGCKPVPQPTPKPIPECVPEGGSFAGDNDFCAMALVACEPRDQYVYWSKPQCGCGCIDSSQYEQYYRAEMEKDTKSVDYKPEPQYTSNNGEYIKNGHEMNVYSETNTDNNHNNYGAKDGDKSGYASSPTDKYDGDKYKKYYNDEPKDNLNDYKKNYRISDSVAIPVSDAPIIDAPVTSDPITSSPDSADIVFPDEFPLTTDDQYDDMIEVSDIIHAENELMNVDDTENKSFEDKLKESSGVLALVAVICAVLISLVLFMKVCCGCCNRERGKGQIVADEEEEEDLGIDDV